MEDDGTFPLAAERRPADEQRPERQSTSIDAESTQKYSPKNDTIGF
jgi:hypothetical protein